MDLLNASSLEKLLGRKASHDGIAGLLLFNPVVDGEDVVSIYVVDRGFSPVSIGGVVCVDGKDYQYSSPVTLEQVREARAGSG